MPRSLSAGSCAGEYRSTPLPPFKREIALHTASRLVRHRIPGGCTGTLCVALLSAAAQPPAAPAPAAGDGTIAYFSHEARGAQLAYEATLRDMISPDRLRAWHELTSSRPHIAGTEGDRLLCDQLEAAFNDMGLNVERHEIDVYVAYPVSASVSIMSPERIELPITEQPLTEDPDTAHPDLTIGWNAYSGSGEVTAGVVYANYGTKEDFDVLRDLGVDCGGKIVIARYGGNYRGYKAKFAEQAGAAGLLIYTDPRDAGFARGPVYPEGGYANETYIQRGSILTLDYPGDPLTPFTAVEEGVERLNPDEVALPTIPVQPIGWGAAREIMSRMTGEAAPPPWVGAMPIEYRLTGGDQLRVRLAVEQERRIARTSNIIATLPGTDWATDRIIIGAHHDAWSFGAGDPNCGTIAVLEAARCFAELAAQGQRPRRTLMFACWGAEEFGIIGSTEWVELRETMLYTGAIAYFNLDMASMGVNFGSSASPTLKPVIMDATRYIEQPTPPGEADETAAASTVYDRWLRQAQGVTETDEPRFGDLGGGSDHVAFYCYVGIPSASIGGSGARGHSYHSNYETLTWYRQVVGADYASARMVAQTTSLAAARLANAPIIPLAPSRYATDLPRHLEALTRRARERGLVEEDEHAPQSLVLEQFEPMLSAARSFRSEAELLDQLLRSPAIVARQDQETIQRINRTLLMLERNWLDHGGVPGRRWFRNSWAATDEDSGYAAWMLPMIRAAIEHDDRDALGKAALRYAEVFRVLRDRVRYLRESLAL